VLVWHGEEAPPEFKWGPKANLDDTLRIAASLDLGLFDASPSGGKSILYDLLPERAKPGRAQRRLKKVFHE